MHQLHLKTSGNFYTNVKKLPKNLQTPPRLGPESTPGLCEVIVVGEQAVIGADWPHVFYSRSEVTRMIRFSSSKSINICNYNVMMNKESGRVISYICLVSCRSRIFPKSLIGNVKSRDKSCHFAFIGEN